MPNRHTYDKESGENLTAIVAEELRRYGQVKVSTPHQTQRDLIRSAGRRAGRQLNRPVRTFEHGQTVTVLITDWGQSNPLETRLQEAQANNRINRALSQL